MAVRYFFFNSILLFDHSSHLNVMKLLEILRNSKKRHGQMATHVMVRWQHNNILLFDHSSHFNDMKLLGCTIENSV